MPKKPGLSLGLKGDAKPVTSNPLLDEAEHLLTPERIIRVRLLDLERLGEIQSREMIDPETVAEYARVMKRQMELWQKDPKRHRHPAEQWEPLDVFQEEDGGPMYDADGFHRTDAGLEAGVGELRARLHQGGIRKATLFALQANVRHGKRITNADKRRAVLRMLRDPEWSTWTDPKIGDHCGASHEFVRQRRAEVEAEAARDRARVSAAAAQALGDTQPPALPATPSPVPEPGPKRIDRRGHARHVHAARPALPPAPATIAGSSGLRPVDAGPAAEEEAGWQVGDRVRIEGASVRELNGRTGTLLALRKEQWQLWLDDEDGGVDGIAAHDTTVGARALKRLGDLTRDEALQRLLRGKTLPKGLRRAAQDAYDALPQPGAPAKVLSAELAAPLQVRSPAAWHKAQAALDKMQRAQRLLEEAAQELSPVIGMDGEHGDVLALYDRVKAGWYKLNGALLKKLGTIRLDSEPA